MTRVRLDTRRSKVPCATSALRLTTPLPLPNRWMSEVAGQSAPALPDWPERPSLAIAMTAAMFVNECRCQLVKGEMATVDSLMSSIVRDLERRTSTMGHRDRA
jgi:hypothetical protein